TVDEATEMFLAVLRASRTDLARLIERALTRRPSVLVVSDDAVNAWKMRAPNAWDQACRWLAARGRGIVRAGEADGQSGGDWETEPPDRSKLSSLRRAPARVAGDDQAIAPVFEGSETDNPA